MKGLRRLRLAQGTMGLVWEDSVPKRCFHGTHKCQWSHCVGAIGSGLSPVVERQWGWWEPCSQAPQIFPGTVLWGSRQGMGAAVGCAQNRTPWARRKHVPFLLSILGVFIAGEDNAEKCPFCVLSPNPSQ